MFDTLIREAATRFHLGDNAGPFVRMLVDAIFDNDNGGFAGLRTRFNDAGLGDLFASWIGGNPGDNVLQPDQFSAGFGSGLASNIAHKLGIPMAAVNMAGAWLLPKIVGGVTRGGVVPTSRPAEYDSWFGNIGAAAAGAAGAAVHGVAHAADRVGDAVGDAARGTARAVDRGVDTAAREVREAASGGMGFLKWLIPLILLLGAFLLFKSCKKDEVAPVQTAPVATEQAAPAAPAATVNSKFGFENVDGKVTVNGQVASDADKTKLWDALKATFGDGNVNGDIVVDPATAPAGWMDKLIAMLPDLKAKGLKFGFDGDKLNIDTSGLSEAERFALSERMRKDFGGYEITGLWDRAMAALAGLKAGFTADDLVKALDFTNIYFDTGSANISRDSLETLTKAAEAIKAAPAGTKIEVSGHTDNTGDAAANMTLSQQRADAVVAKLQELGVAAGVLTAKGYGQDKPVADNNTEEGRAQNRRIDYAVSK